jgi:phenol 2-monooxygenase
MAGTTEHQKPTQRADTLIVGGGPIGLLLANQLLRFKTSVIQIEREDKPNAPIYGRACTTWCRTLELLDQLDLCEPLMNDGVVTTTGVNYRNVSCRVDVRRSTCESPY